MRNRYVAVIDAVLLSVAAVVAFVLRFEVGFVPTRLEFWPFLIASLSVKLPLFYAFGLYHRFWRYARAADAIRIVLASTAGSAALVVALVVTGDYSRAGYVSRAVIAIDWLLTVMAAGGIRLAIKLEHDSRLRAQSNGTVGRQRILVVGAGNVGTMVTRMVEQHPEFPMRIVGFIDDEPSKQNKVIYGHRVLGPRTELPRLVAANSIDEVIIAMPTASREAVDEVCEACDRVGVRKRVIPSISSLLHGTLSIDDLRVWRSATFVTGSTGSPATDVAERTYDRLLVTGGAGFIGANFVRYWLTTYPSSTVVVLDKLTYAGTLDNLLGLDSEHHGRYFFVEGDICDKECVRRCIDDYGIEAVVNFAAETHVDRSLYFPDVFLRTNVMGTQTLLEVIRHRSSVRRFHQVSTDEVYGQVLRGSFSEEDPLDTRSPYSASKAGADMLVLAYAASYGVSATITRGSNSIGPYQYPEKVVPLFVTSAIDGEALPVYGDGRYIRDYQYVLDHCRGIDVVLRRGAPGEIYNLGGGNEVEALALARMIVAKLGRPSSLIKLVADRDGQDRRYSLNCAKIKALGWAPQFDLEQGLDHTIKWYVENEWWWRKIKSGEYKEYFDRQLRWRLEAAVADVLQH
jgi:dTDP-glucose 4,6-dehydratase